MIGNRHGRSLWATASWQREALAWVDAALSLRGITRLGDDPAPRIRTWATVMRLPTDHGTVWFKAASPVTAHEVALYPLLRKTVPDLTLRPLAVDAERRWLLLPDGGPSLMRSASGDELFARLEAMLPHYARLQIALMPHASSMLSLGVPDMRPETMPGRFDEALEITREVAAHYPEDGDGTLLARLTEHRQAYTTMCARLAESSIPETLDHGDLHSNNIVPTAGGVLFYDWGDCVVAHPFSTMLVFERFVADARETDRADARFQRFRNSYLSGFRQYGSVKELSETLDIACHVATVTRALTFAHVLALGPLPDPSWNRAPLRWMASLLEPSIARES